MHTPHAAAVSTPQQVADITQATEACSVFTAVVTHMPHIVLKTETAAATWAPAPVTTVQFPVRTSL